MKSKHEDQNGVIGLGYKSKPSGYQNNSLTTEDISNGYCGRLRTASDLYSEQDDDMYTDWSPDPPEQAGPDGGCLDRDSHVVDVQGLTYTVREWQGSWWKGCCCRPRVDKQVLHEVNMQIKAGQLTAILGNSGSGKTSLLDVISCRHTGQIEGNVTFDRQPLTKDIFREKAGYVIQADRLLANLTVRETLMYTAQLKFTGQEKHTVIKERVCEVLSSMGLSHVADSKVGGHIVRGISGGERRRVSIAVQLLQDPYLLLLDEPTTGLDSFTAHYLVSSLARLAHSLNRIVLLTIHQPRSDIYQLFDQIGILSQGQVIYYGPRTQLVPHFTRLGHPCPTYANPLDHYVDVASIDRRDMTSELTSTERVRQLRQSYLASVVYHDVMADMKQSASHNFRNHFGSKPNKYSAGRSLPLFSVLIRRMYLNLWRDRSSVAGRIIYFPTFAFFLWIFLWKLNNNFETAVQDRTGIIFETVSAACIMGLLNAVALFPAHRDLYDREAREGLYDCGHMLTAYCIHIIPTSILASLIYSTWCYWGLGLYPEAERYFIFFAMCLVQHYLGELITVMFLGVFHNVGIAQSTSTLILTMFTMIGPGLIRSQEGLPTPIYWLSYSIYYKYASEVMVANEYHLLNFTCPEENKLPCERFTGDDYLDTMFPGAVANMGRNVGILAAYTAGVWLLLYFLYRVRGIKHLN